jgi:hypothetical protein
MKLSDEVVVPLWVVVYAIKFGVGRETFANMEVAEIARYFWNDIPSHVKDGIKDSALKIPDMEERSHWNWLIGT